MVDTVQTAPPDRNLLAISLLIEKWKAGFDPYGPSGTANQEFKTLDAYLRSIFGDLPEGAVDWDTGDLDDDGVNEVYAVDADGNPITVYGYDDDGNVTSTPFGQDDTGIDNGDGTSRYGSHNLPNGYIYDHDKGAVVNTDTGEEYPVTVGMYGWHVNLPNTTEDNGGSDAGGGDAGGGNAGGGNAGGSDGGGGDAGGSDAGGGNAGGGNGGDDTDGPLDVLGKDWEYDPEHDYIYIGDCTFVQVDENGTPIGDPVVLDEEDCLENTYTVGGNYSGPDRTWDPNIDIDVDIFGEGSIFDTTKDQTPTESKPTSEPEEKEKEKDKDDTTTTTSTTNPNTTPTENKQTTEEEKKDKDGMACTTTNEDGEPEEGVYDNGVCTVTTTTISTTTQTPNPTQTPTEDKQTTETTDDVTKDGETELTFENLYTYYTTKNGGDNGGDGGDGGDDNDGDGGGTSSGMLAGRNSFTPQREVPPYTTPTYAPITVPQKDYMTEINNLITRNNSGLFKDYV